jgi:hypothetical protein
MTTTFENLADEVQMNLSGYTFQQDRSTHLTADVSASTSTIASPIVLSLGSTDNVGKGVVEIDEELIWVDNYDRVANTAVVAPYGRGYNGTTKAAHTAGTKVTISPTFPRIVVKRAINDTIRAMGTQIAGVFQTSFTYNAAQTTYSFVGKNVKSILSISWKSIGPSKEWIPVRHWEFDSYADIATYGDNVQTITIGDYIQPGRTVKVLYATDPIPLEGDSAADFTDITGLQASCKDVIVYGAAYRLVSFLDPARASQVSPQADETDSKRPYGASNAAVKQLYALYNQRLQEEILEQQRHYPIRVHYNRR